jgi:ASC-1-like (ASCH) protein
MRLDAGPFAAVRSGAKKYEIRLYDDKRHALIVGDTVIFWNKDAPQEEIAVAVTEVVVRPSFVELFRVVAPGSCGWPVGTSPEQAAVDMRKYYSVADEDRWGAVAVKLGVAKS